MNCMNNGLIIKRAYCKYNDSLAFGNKNYRIFVQENRKSYKEVYFLFVLASLIVFAASLEWPSCKLSSFQGPDSL